MITPLAPHPAAMLKSGEHRILVIADLHIGWEVALSNEGIHVPSQTPKLTKKLVEILEEHKPEKLLIIGDVKHTVATAEKIEWQDVPEFFTEIRRHVPEIMVIRGNHDGNLDPLLPENIKTLPATGAVIGDTGFFHGHQWPSPELLGCKILVMGHVHPVIAFRDRAGFRSIRPVWAKMSIDPTELTRAILRRNKIKTTGTAEDALYEKYNVRPKANQLFIMPSFNEFLGGKPLNAKRPKNKLDSEKVAGPILRSGAVALEKAETYLLDGTVLGTIEQLRAFS